MERRSTDRNALQVALTTHSSEQGFGVAVSRRLKVGSVGCKRVPKLAGVGLEPYRANALEAIPGGPPGSRTRHQRIMSPLL